MLRKHNTNGLDLKVRLHISVSLMTSAALLVCDICMWQNMLVILEVHAKAENLSVEQDRPKGICLNVSKPSVSSRVFRAPKVHTRLQDLRQMPVQVSMKFQ